MPSDIATEIEEPPDGNAVVPPPMLPPSPVNPMFQAVMAIQALNARADAVLMGMGDNDLVGVGDADKTKISKSEMTAKLEAMSADRLHAALKNSNIDAAIKKLIERELDDRANRGTSRGFRE